MIVDLETAHLYLSKLLVGMVFESFSFEAGSFDLIFVNYEVRTKFPRKINLRFSDTWQCGDDEEWNSRIKAEGCGVDPDVPVQAFELANLCHSTYGKIKKVILESRVCFIFFENDTVVSSRFPDDGYELYFLEITETKIASDPIIWFEAQDNYFFIRDEVEDVGL